MPPILVRAARKIDLEACSDPADLALAKTIKRRIDAAARGETPMVTWRREAVGHS
jgi:hypothetical protein